MNDGSANNKTPIIYTAGYYTDYTGKTHACRWTGTEMEKLAVPDNAGDSNADAIAVEGGTVYTAGYYYDHNNNRHSCFWMDTLRADLSIPAGFKESFINAFTVENWTVYTTGRYSRNMQSFMGNERENHACYWKGTEMENLAEPNDARSSHASALTVINGKVYTAGYFYTTNNQYACFWKGTERIDLSVPGNCCYSSAAGITVVDDIVYIAGDYADRNWRGSPCYWKNNKRMDLKSPTPGKLMLPSDIVVKNGIVYTKGFYFLFDDEGLPTEYSCCWIGTEYKYIPVPENAKYTYIKAFTVSNNTVFTAGNYENHAGRNRACYWKGTERIELTDSDNVGSSDAKAIVVANNTVYTAGYYLDLPNQACFWIGDKVTELSAPLDHKGACVNALAVEI